MPADLPASLALTVIQTNAQILSADHRNNYLAIQTAVNQLRTIMAGGTSKQLLSAVDADTLEFIGGYTDYSPSLAWTSTGSAPAFGNSTKAARYVQLGKLVHYFGIVQFGSSATFGTGDYRFSLPVTANTGVLLGTISIFGGGMIFDNSASAYGTPSVSLQTNTTLELLYGATYLGTVTRVGQLTPWTWAQSDIISWNMIYEAA